MLAAHSVDSASADNLLIVQLDEFFEEYKPLENPFNKRASFDGCMFDFTRDEIQHVLRIGYDNPHLIWTVQNYEGALYIEPGYKLVNRIGYIITKKEWITEDLSVETF